MRWFVRFLKLLLVLFLVAAGAVATYVWRSFPSLDGEQRAGGLEGAVQIRRDRADVTHIQAANIRDVSFALGWVHAQERSWQLEFNRRVMHGQLSELFGPQTLDTDRLMRALGIVQAAQAQWRNLPGDVRSAFTAYADGINSFHASSSQALPPEFHVLGTRPGPWTPEDSVGWALMMALDLGGNWGTEMARLSAAQRVNTRQLWQLFPAYPGDPPTSQVDLSRLYRDLGVFPSQSENAIKTGAIHNETASANNLFAFRDWHQIADWSQGLGHVEGKGSNNWVIAGSYSQSGKPLLANDPHLGLSAPAIWYFARLQVGSAGSGAPALDVIGATLPGLPSVVLGRTAGVAWGFTNTGPDVQDLYLEKINPANPSQYQTPEGWAEFGRRTETIQVKGQGDDRIELRSTRHGPVLSDALQSYRKLIDTRRYALALRWSALDPDNRTVAGGYRVNFAQTVPQLLGAFADHHSPMQNLVAADTGGQTVFQAIGKVPLRKPGNDLRGVAPAPGWDARYDWAGWMGNTQNPGVAHAAIARKGWHATANQRIHAPDFPYFMGQDWATPERFERIETLLGQAAQRQAKHTLTSLREVQADTHSLATERLLPVLRATPSTHALAAPAKGSLEGFAGQMRPDSAAPLLFAAWVDELTRGLLAPHLGEDKLKTLYGKRHFRSLVESVLRADASVQAVHTGQAAPPGSTPMGHPMSAAEAAAWCAPLTCMALSSQSLGRALDRLQARYGADVGAWRWGDAHFANSSHKPFGNVAALARFFDVNTPTGGDPWTVNVGQYWPNDLNHPFANRHAASLRALYDLADPEQSQFIYQTGQSGLVWSPRYRDMAADWTAVKYRPLQLAPQDWAHQLRLVP